MVGATGGMIRDGDAAAHAGVRAWRRRAGRGRGRPRRASAAGVRGLVCFPRREPASRPHQRRHTCPPRAGVRVRFANGLIRKDAPPPLLWRRPRAAVPPGL